MSWAYAYKKPNLTPCPRVGRPKAPKGASKTLKTLVTYSGRAIRKGDRFPAVKAVQKTVGAKQTGTWSSSSVTRLKAFQGRHDLKATGKLNYATWRALQKANAPK